MLLHLSRNGSARRSLCRATSCITKASNNRTLILLSKKSPNNIGFKINNDHFVNFLKGHQSVRTLSGVQKLKHLNYEVKDGILVIRLDDPNSKVNSLGEGLMEDAAKVFNDLYSGTIQAKGCVLTTAKSDCFVAGADIKMISKMKSQAEAERIILEGQDFFNKMVAAPIPIVSAIKGTCLGGGLELALATHYRIAVNDKKTSFGLPEVMLGLLPGGGGTQRLPRLINVPDAMQMMLKGQNIVASRAKKMGFVDLLVEPLGPGVEPADVRTLDFLENVAITVCKKLADKEMKIERKRPLQERLFRDAMKIQFLRDKVMTKARDEVNKFAKGNYPAPLKIIECIDTALKMPLEEGLRFEAKRFAELSQTPESKALIGLFFGQTLCKKNRFGNPPNPPKTLAVLGAGLMGAGIAQVSVDNGYTCFLKDAAQQGLVRGQSQIMNSFDTKVKRNRLSLLERNTKMANLIPTLSYDRFKNVDLIIEAVFEDIKVKHKVVQECEAIIRDDCIFATNTSAIPISEIAKASKRPENVVGMHYFSPVDKMMLLEIITSDKTSKEAVAAAVDVGLKQKKTVIVVKDGPGFYTTRCLAPVLSEILLLLQEGVSPKDLDDMSTKSGFPVGVATLCDEVGIDVASHVLDFLAKSFPERMAGGNPNLLIDMAKMGYCGRKTGKGWFIYDSSKKDGKRDINPGSLDLLKKYSVTPKMKCTIEDYQMRLTYKFVNEAVSCLQEGILDNPLEGDIGAVFGLGFPPFLGGPFRFTDFYTAQRVVDVGHRFTDIYGPQFKPCQLLIDHAKNGTKFHKPVD